MTAQQEASVADERVEAIARTAFEAWVRGNGVELDWEDLPLTSPDDYESCLEIGRRIAALWPAPAEDEVEAAADSAAFTDALAEYWAAPSWETRIKVAHAALSVRQPKPAHDAEVREAAIRECIARVRKYKPDRPGLTIGVLSVLLTSPPSTHDAEVADAAVRRCLTAIETKTAVYEGLDEYDAGYRLGIMAATEVCRALLTSEPSNG